AWWIRAQVSDAGLRGLMPEAALSEVDPSLPQDAPLPLTRGLHAAWLAREDLQQTFELAAAWGRKAIVVWWFVERQLEPWLRYLIPERALYEAAPGVPADAGRCITRGEQVLLLSRADLSEAFDIGMHEGRVAYLQWLKAFGCQTEGGVAPPVVAPIAASPACAEGGVNVIGYGRGEFGIGEDVRMAVRALEDAGVEVCVPRLPLHVAARQDDISVIGYEVPTPLYSTSLICLPHLETLRVLAESGQSMLDGRYNVGYWQWELPYFPSAMTCALDVVDEIWSSSEFTASAMRAATDKPVFRMPMAVSLPPSQRGWCRADFGLPDDSFVFLTVLDGNSSLKRKNPLVTVCAFLTAFSREKQVHLVVKAMNVSAAQPDWRRVLEYCAKDERITVIVDTMTKDKLLGLQSVCDGFVSLHRSEGFGRNIAEAMLLGKPVIVSDYSGNRDFTRPETAFLVSGDVVPLLAGDYPFWEGQRWFEADVDAASAMLLKCFERPDLRQKIAEAGKAWILEHYSPARVGQTYRARLNVLQDAERRGFEGSC
ncbi:glycosyltransferase family 4 protein, partial [Aromatoleum toluclasticum]|uniref:glycosyltransferase family 4 protein n=1 Tax=Aromatoleum toluclasticum TaxID=92003 RepID=UPI001D192554